LKKLSEDQHKQLKKLEETFMNDMEDRVRMLMSSSEDAVG